MRALVTGASGFVGRHVADALRKDGAQVRDERVELTDAAAVDRAIAGCETVFHVAALYAYDGPAARFEAVNVEGTRNVVEACVRHGVRRLVFTSTAGTCGPVEGRAASEEDGPPDWELTVPYKRTKLESERLVLAAARERLDAVVVNPTTPIGPGDDKPTPTGKMIAGVARGRVRAYIGNTGLNVVDVRDVARGHVLALERGRRGERYLLGGTDLDLGDLFARVAIAAGRPAPRLKIPYAIPQALAAVHLLNRHEVRLARMPMFFTSAKAARELGYAPGPADAAIAAAVQDVLGRRSLSADPTGAS
ncbi:MAG TPA: NAD-dependent epimerase/dehydratase family protein [Conexibacter sp.]|jgi:dihydroflavonol-4-reductase